MVVLDGAKGAIDPALGGRLVAPRQVGRGAGIEPGQNARLVARPVARLLDDDLLRRGAARVPRRSCLESWRIGPHPRRATPPPARRRPDPPPRSRCVTRARRRSGKRSRSGGFPVRRWCPRGPFPAPGPRPSRSASVARSWSNSTCAAATLTRAATRSRAAACSIRTDSSAARRAKVHPTSSSTPNSTPNAFARRSTSAASSPGPSKSPAPAPPWRNALSRLAAFPSTVRGPLDN